MQAHAALGFVVVDLEALRHRRRRPVFRTWDMAQRWMSLRGISGAEVHAVCLPSRIEWRRPGGRLAGIELADQSFHVEVSVAVPQPRRRA